PRNCLPPAAATGSARSAYPLPHRGRGWPSRSGGRVRVFANTPVLRPLTPPSPPWGRGCSLPARIDRRQALAGHLYRVRVDQDKGEDARLRPGRDPGVHRAALYADVAGFHAHGLAVVELEVAFALEQDRIVERLGAVHEFVPAGRKLD